MEEFKRIKPSNRDIILKIDNDISLLRGEVLELKVILESIIKDTTKLDKGSQVKTNNGWFGY
tara:strand:- start:191 stop:376 length:186 start_codon:yes stop_codon:yes gene_type:complete